VPLLENRMSDVHRSVLSQKGVPNISWAQAGKSGPDILLIHGAIVTLEDMVLSLFPTLSLSARVTAFDRPGHGGSAPDRLAGSPWRQADILHSAASSLGLRHPVVVGHSFGAAVAMAYGLQFPEDTKGVLAISPIVYPELRLEHLMFGPRAVVGAGELLNIAMQATADPALLPILWNAMFLPQAMPRIFAEQFPFKIAGRAQPMMAESEDALYLNAGLIRSLYRYANCKVPVEIFLGEADQVANPLHGRVLAALTPNARLTCLAGYGHMLHHFVPSMLGEVACDMTARIGPGGD